MARGLPELEKLCNALPDRIDKAASEMAIDVTISMARDLIVHTPVDITTAVSNWQASIGVPASFELPAIYPGEKGSTAPASRAEALGHVTRTLEDKDPGATIYLSNLTPYIIDLNNGTSAQEPAGFFERGVLVGERYAQTATLRF